MSQIEETTAKLIVAICLYNECTPVEFIEALIGIAWDNARAGRMIEMVNN